MINNETEDGNATSERATAGVREAWSLTGSAFGKLLRALGDSESAAAEKYESLRLKLTKLFQFWGAFDADELTDETMNRVARKIDGGEVIRSADVGRFFRGVARLVFLESLRKRERDRKVLEYTPPVDALSDRKREERLDCLDRCLGTLPADQRELILRYYSENGGAKIETRRSLAGEMKVSPTALRIRAHRLREKLESCVRSCAGGTA